MQLYIIQDTVYIVYIHALNVHVYKSQPVTATNRKSSMTVYISNAVAFSYTPFLGIFATMSYNVLRKGSCLLQTVDTLLVMPNLRFGYR